MFKIFKNNILGILTEIGFAIAFMLLGLLICFIIGIWR